MITVFTPTYNREKILGQCYESLVSQTNQLFNWLIVDDGSSDRTEYLVQKWIKEAKINITYIKQENSGKHVAHNTGVKNCTTELFVCIDSDDYLKPDAIEKIYIIWDNVRNNSDIAGMGFLKQYANGKIVGTRMPKGLSDVSIYDLYEKFHFKGDIALVFRTAILKQFLFPTFKGEKFVGESVIYDQISEHYKIHLVNEVIYVGEYLDDGYTQNITTLYKNNLQGYMFFLKQRITLATCFSDRYKAIAHYIAESWYLEYTSWFKNCQYKYIMLIALPKASYYFLKKLIKQVLIRLGLLTS